MPACLSSTHSAFEPDATRFLLLLALVPSSLGVLLSFGINYVPFVEASETAHPSSRLSARSRWVGACLWGCMFVGEGWGCCESIS